MFIDHTRPPTSRERKQLESRLGRLRAPGLSEHLTQIATILKEGQHRKRFERDGLRLRDGLACLKSPITGDASDRKAPPRHQRPPATRISSSTGFALRFELTLLAAAQVTYREGAKSQANVLDLPLAGSSSERGLADLIAATPSESLHGRTLSTVRDKRARTAWESLKTLESAGLVDIRRHHGRFNAFFLLNESGREAVRETDPYRVPPVDERHIFQLPAGFVLNGWVHVLEDSEIALLMMVACGRGGWEENGMQVMGGEARLRRYGIHRDPASKARKTLEWFGLLDVKESDRHEDGRAAADQRMLHRFALKPQGFGEPAHGTITTAIEKQLER